MADVLLEVKDLKIHYPVKSKNTIGGKTAYAKAVDGVSFNVYRGETFGVVGESGCGKSTTGKAIVRLLPPTEGSIRMEGQELADIPRKELAKKIQIIFQDPYSSLDPRMTVGRCIEEPLAVHGIGNAAERRQKVLQLMRDVGLREEQYTRFPHDSPAASVSASAWPVPSP